eukprot:g7067.t1
MGGKHSDTLKPVRLRKYVVLTYRMLNSSLLKNELARNVRGHNERRDQRQKRREQGGPSSTPSLVYDVQGHYIKRVWETVFAGESCDGNNVWTDVSEVIGQNRDACGTEQGSKMLRVDFALGPGGNRSGAVVSRFDKKYQRYYGNKRRQYHQLHKLKDPPILPETHFSIHSAIRSIKNGGASNEEDGIWFIKAPGVQRGEGIIVRQGSRLMDLLASTGTADAKESGGGGEHGATASATGGRENSALLLKNSKQWKKHVLQRSPSRGNIACVDGRKADLRMYILHAPDGKIYYFPNAVVRIAQVEYEGNRDVSLGSQLTNVSTGGRIIQGAEWDLFRKSLPSIEKLLQRLVLHSIDWFQLGRCELIGVDIILDTEGTPYLLELNNSPQMGGHDTPYLFRIEMLKQMLHLAVYPSLRSHYCRRDGLVGPFIPPNMPVDRIEWVVLHDSSSDVLGESVGSPAPFPVRFAWLADELVYFEKIIDYLTRNEEKHEPGLGEYFRVLLGYKNGGGVGVAETNECMVKPNVEFDRLGCIGVIIHPSLPNEEVVCLGYKGKCWLLREKLYVFNSMVLSNDGIGRKLEQTEVEKGFREFIEHQYS